MSTSDIWSSEYTEPSYLTPSMDTMYQGEFTPDLNSMFESVSTRGKQGINYDYYNDFATKWQKLPIGEQLAAVRATDKGETVDQYLQNSLDVTPFKSLTAEQAAANLRIEPGSVEEKTYVDYFNGVRKANDPLLETSLRKDYYKRIQDPKYAVDDEIWERAQSGESILRLQQSVRGLDRPWNKYPRLFVDEAIGGISRAAVGSAQAGLMVAYAADRGVNEIRKLTTGKGNNTWGATLESAIRRIDEVGPYVGPVVKEGLLDDIVGGVGQAAGMIGVAAATGGLGAAQGTISGASRFWGSKALASVLGGPPIATAMTIGLATNDIMEQTKGIENLGQRMAIAAPFIAISAAVEYSQLDRFMQLGNQGGPWRNYLASVLSGAAQGFSEEYVQGMASGFALSIANEITTGQWQSPDWLGTMYEGVVGAGVSAVLGAGGGVSAYGRSRENNQLLGKISELESASLNLVTSKDVPEDLKYRAFVESLGDLGRQQIHVRADELISQGPEAVAKFSTRTGIPESTIRKAAADGTGVRATLAPAFYASLEEEARFYQTRETRGGESTQPANSGISQNVGTPTDVGGDFVAPISGVPVGDLAPDGENVPTPTPPRSIFETLSSTEVNDADKTSALLALRNKNLRRTGQEVSVADQNAINEILTLAKSVDDTDRIRQAVENGTATPRELERYNLFMEADNAEGSLEGIGRPASEVTQPEGTTEDAGTESIQPDQANQYKKRYLVNLDAQTVLRQRVKEFVTDGRRKAMHELFRAAPETASINEIRLNAETIQDMLVEGQQVEKISELDNLKAIKDLRAELTAATNGDTAYVSKMMHLLKTFVVHQGEANGLTPEQYKSSFYLGVFLRSPVIKGFTESISSFSRDLEAVKVRLDGEYVKRLVSSGEEIDNTTAMERLASGQDTADGMLTPDGQRVGFVWNNYNRMLAKISKAVGADNVTLIPDIITNGEMSQVMRGNTRYYTTPEWRLTLNKINGTYYPTNMERITPRVVVEGMSPEAQNMLDTSKLEGPRRDMLQNILQYLDSGNNILEPLSYYEVLAERVVNAENAINGFIDEITASTGGFTNIPDGLINVLGLELPDNYTPEDVSQALKDKVAGLRQRILDTRNFYLPGATPTVLTEFTPRAQILESGNLNVDGLSYRNWLSAAANGDYTQAALRRKRLNDGSERAPFSSFEDFTSGYDRQRLQTSLRDYLRTKFEESWFKDTKIRRDAQSASLEEFFNESGIIEYIAGFAEYTGFVLNTDPRIFADIRLDMKSLPRTTGGEYNPNTNAISINTGRARNMLDYLRLYKQPGEQRTNAIAGLASTIVHEFNHSLMYQLAASAYNTGSIRVGPLYQHIVESIGIPQAGRDFELALEQSVEGVTGDRQQYLSEYREQLANIASNTFLRNLGATGIADRVEGQYNGLPAELFQDPVIRDDLAKIQTLFTATQQPQLIQMLESETRFQTMLGAIVKLGARSYTIELSGSKFNYSTIPHEFCHLFLDLMKTDNPDLRRQLNDYTSGLLDSSDKEVQYEAEERLVRQFEVYLLQGSAPAMHLRETFDGMSKWLGNIYDQEFRGNNAVDENLKRLFDKFFVSEQQIRYKEAMAGVEQSFLDMLADTNPKKRPVLTAEKKAKYSARERERRRIVGEYMKLSGEAQAMRDEARYNVSRDPINTLTDEAALQNIISRKKLYGWDGSNPINENMRPEFETLLAEWNATNPDIAFPSVEAALEAMRNKGDRTNQVEAEFRRVRDERLAQIINDSGGLDTLSDKAVFSNDMTVYLDKLQEAVNSERDTVANRMLQASLSAAAKSQAITDFNNQTVSEARNYKHYIGDMRSNLEKFAKYMHDKDPVNASVYLDKARQAQAKVQESINLRDQLTRLKYDWQRNVSKRLAPVSLQHQDNIIAILNAFGINNRIQPSSLEPMTRLNLPEVNPDDPGVGITHMLMNLRDTISPLAQSLTLPHGAESYEQMTVAEFTEVMDSIRYLEKVGTSDLKSLKQSQYASAPALIADSIKRMEKRKPRSRDYRKADTTTGKIKNVADKVGIYGLLNEYIFMAADGLGNLAKKGFGPMANLFYTIREASSTAEASQKLYQAKLNTSLKAWRDSFTSSFDPTLYGELPAEIRNLHGQTEWTPEMVLMIALNSGNTGNLKALTEGYNMSMAQVQDIMNTIPKEGLKAVQGIWDILEELYTPSVEVWYNIAGKRPKRVDPMPMTYTNGTLKGGYFPLVTEKGTPNGSNYFANLFPSMEQNPSYLKDRSGTVRPPVLDVSVLANHIYTATRLINLGEPMDVANKILRDKNWSDMFKSRFGNARYNEVLNHFGMVANPHSIYRNNTIGGQVLDWVRQSAITAALGLRFVSGLKQRLDIFQATNVMIMQNRATTGEVMKGLLSNHKKLGIKGLLGFVDMARRDSDGNIRVNGEIVSEDSLSPMQIVYLKSDVMAMRENRVDMNLQHLAKNAVGQGGRKFNLFGREVGWSDVNDAFFAFIKLNDRSVSSAVWLTQYELAKEGKGTFALTGLNDVEIERLAIRDADAVALTMSSNALIDQTAGQRDPLMRLFTSFLSGQVRRTSRMYSTVQAFRAGQISAKNMLTSLGLEIYSRMIVGALGTYLFYGLGGDEPEEIDYTKLGYTILTEPLWSTIETVPIGNSLAGYMRGYGRNPLNTPGQEKLGLAIADMGRAWKGMTEGNAKDAFFYTGRSAGFFFRVPVAGVHGDLKKLYEFINGEEKRHGRR